MKIIEKHHDFTQHLRLDYHITSFIVFSFILYAAWTLAYQIATFLHIPYKNLAFTAKLLVIPFALLIIRSVTDYSYKFVRQLCPRDVDFGIRSPFLLIGGLLYIGLLFYLPGYEHKILVSLIFVFSLITYRQYIDRHSSDLIFLPELEHNRNHQLTAACLFLYVVFTLVVVLATHRTDLDDASFLQIAAQTLQYGEKAPLTYDASLGELLENFRFAPYRFTSYETLVAFIASATPLSIPDVYYFLMPAISVLLSVGMAYIFSRWFLPHQLALLSTGMFLILMFSWGESHYVFGNRVFTRLFQGKGLLIALTTPFTILAGLALIRLQTLPSLLLLAVANIVAIGVSSTGLVICLFTTLLVMLVTFSRNSQEIIPLLLKITISLTLPLACVLWLKFFNQPGVPMSNVGTYKSINVSLGNHVRTVVTFCLIILGAIAIGKSQSRKEYLLIATGTLAIILNPWFADFLASMTARNMSWRLAWASPIPLLMSIGLVAVVGPAVRWHFPRNSSSMAGAFIAILLVSTFFVGGNWTLAKSNRADWGWPAHKLPPHFYITHQIADTFRPLGMTGRVLTSRDIGAWIPLVAPDIRLVMPGHTYPIMLRTILPHEEFMERMKLYGFMQKNTIRLSDMEDLLAKYDVEALIIRSNVKIIPSLSGPTTISERIECSGYTIVIFSRN